jgi:hypothetical protein
MAYMDADAPSVEPEKPTKTDAKPSGRLRKYWREVEAYNKAAEDWHRQSDTIVKMYLDQHRSAASGRRFALLWSNIETLKPSVYAKTPNVLCSRRHKDPDPIGRVAAEILERATNTTLDLYKVDERFRMVRDDRLLTSRGSAWVRYEADTTGDKINYEKVCVDYVHWKDLGHNVAGTWADVWLLWRKVYKTRQENTERFGKKVADKLTYSAKTAADDDKEMGEHKACIYEIWDKTKNKVCFISKDCPEILEDGPPPTNFHDFFPTPEPCYGTKTSKSLFPTPDYRYYQDQAQEIDDLTAQIAGLTDLLTPRGFIPAGPSADGADAVRIMIQSLQSQLTQNKTIFIPVEAWAAFSERGGAKGLIEWMPVQEFVVTLKGAIDARNQLVQDVYQITGIADILRGQTDPDETLGAQQLKAQTGARRVKNTKDEVARFCRDIGRLVAEVIAEQFQPQTLADMSGFAYVPAPPIQPGMMPGMGAPQAAQGPSVGGLGQSPSGKTFDDKVVQLLRDDRMRGFLIDIETDSTIQPDEDAEKQRRTEFLTAMGGFLQQSGEMMQVAPSLFPLVSEMALFGVRGYRVGRQMEDTIETTLKQVAMELQQRQQQPDPAVAAEQAKTQAQMELEQFKVQSANELKQMELAHDKERMAAELQMQAAELQMKEQEAVSKLQLEQVKAENETRLREMEANHKMQIAEKEAEQKAQIAAMEAQQNAQIQQQEAETGMQFKQAEFAQKREMEAQKFNDERQRAVHEFDGDQKRKAKAFEADEGRKEKAHKVETDTKVGLMKERAAAEAKEPKEPKKPKRVVVRKRDGDGKPAEYEIN